MKQDVNKLGRQMQEALARQDWPKALNACEGLLAAMPDHAALHYNRALVLRRLDRDQEAAHGFRQTLERDPGHGNARFELASVLLETGDAAQAAALLEAYLQNQPNDTDAMLNLGNAQLALGKSDEALGLLTAAHAAAPSDLSLRSLAIARRDKGDIEGCRALLRERQETQTNAADNLKILTHGPKGRISLSAIPVSS
ncbi:tetratricopeptide repeat protein [Hoeflea sp. CAU 1731]